MYKKEISGYRRRGRKEGDGATNTPQPSRERRRNERDRESSEPRIERELEERDGHQQIEQRRRRRSPLRRCRQQFRASTQRRGEEDREASRPSTSDDGTQYDVYGNLFGLLAAHPVTPLVSLHHLDVVEPIFPNVSRVEALQRLTVPMKLDSAGLMQQSICYDKSKSWTISVSWGFAVQIFRGVFSPREMEMPSRTFLNWYRRADYTAYAFNTRPVSRHPCQKPFVFYLSKARLNSTTQQTLTEYERHRIPHPECRWKMANPAFLDRVEVYKKPDPHLWDRAPRRNCCRVVKSSKKKKGTMVIHVGVCGEGEVSEA
ncbi:hypothetical protein Ahy_B03g064204 isoform B [Arachis hypogaea]|uniref:Uncharacterized protein n=1 Tax=Arachis hypogaea TaxID=3818 RepID=A0A444ZZ41_ARAHY|nr:hypothetical protein Ahy_B03g064204 isoform B [Arachis hypogaea]